MTSPRTELSFDSIVELASRLSMTGTEQQRTMLDSFIQTLNDECSKEETKRIITQLKGEDDNSLLVRKVFSLMGTHHDANFNLYGEDVTYFGNASQDTRDVKDWLMGFFPIQKRWSGKHHFHKLEHALRTYFDNHHVVVGGVKQCDVELISSWKPYTSNTIILSIRESLSWPSNGALLGEINIEQRADWFIRPLIHQQFEALPDGMLKVGLDMFFINVMSEAEPQNKTYWQSLSDDVLDGVKLHLDGKRIRWVDNVPSTILDYQPFRTESERCNPLMDLIYRHLHKQAKEV